MAAAIITRTIALKTGVIEYRLRRSRAARRVSLRVNVEKGLEVVLPWRAPEYLAEQFLSMKQDWVLRHLAKVKIMRSNLPRRQLVAGVKIPFLDGVITLRLKRETRQRSRVKYDAAELTVTLSASASPRAAIARWYRVQAKSYFENLTQQLAQPLSTTVGRVSIGDTKSQWGSAGPGGRLAFNWRLMLAPAAVARYVAAHEVAHLKHRNHSKDFWWLVAELMPDYEQHRQWLRKNGFTLVL